MFETFVNVTYHFTFYCITLFKAWYLYFHYVLKTICNYKYSDELLCLPIKIIVGFCSSAILKSNLIVFSVSPCHFETRSELDNEKNVLFVAAVAAAFARYDFPVPGGLKSKILKCKMLSAIKTN